MRVLPTFDDRDDVLDRALEPTTGPSPRKPRCLDNKIDPGFFAFFLARAIKGNRSELLGDLLKFDLLWLLPVVVAACRSLVTNR